jgi:hypothetical protein
MSWTVSIVLLGPRPPPPTDDQCPLLGDPSYARIRSHCVLRLLNMFPVDLMSLHWLHDTACSWCPPGMYDKLSIQPVSRWNALSVLFHARCAVTPFLKIPSYKCQRGKTLKICNTYSHNIK